MEKTKRSLRIAGVVCLAAMLLSIYYLISDYRGGYGTFYIVSDVVEIILCLVTACTYFVYSAKDEGFLFKGRNVFFILSFVNIFNNLIAWIASFWMQIVVSGQIRKTATRKMYYDLNQESEQKTYDYNSSNVIDVEDYDVNDTALVLAKKLEELKQKYKNGEISQEEYEELRQQVIDKYMD